MALWGSSVRTRSAPPSNKKACKLVCRLFYWVKLLAWFSATQWLNIRFKLPSPDPIRRAVNQAGDVAASIVASSGKVAGTAGGVNCPLIVECSTADCLCEWEA